mmetsp:Transcript_4076/g.11201  ORF Transcript_4076/g.11201 Transcript_4076/m.11201 type:complete len:155 (+) Transcript_4076:330-794(+)
MSILNKNLESLLMTDAPSRLEPICALHPPFSGSLLVQSVAALVIILRQRRRTQKAKEKIMTAEKLIQRRLEMREKKKGQSKLRVTKKKKCLIMRNNQILMKHPKKPLSVLLVPFLLLVSAVASSVAWLIQRCASFQRTISEVVDCLYVFLGDTS